MPETNDKYNKTNTLYKKSIDFERGLAVAVY